MRGEPPKQGGPSPQEQKREPAPPQQEREPAEQAWERQALRKIDDFRRAKRRGDNTLRMVAQVGVLAWVFLLPVLIAGWIAHVSLEAADRRWLALPLLSLGVFIGGALVRRRVLTLLRGDDE